MDGSAWSYEEHFFTGIAIGAILGATENYCNLSILPFDPASAIIFDNLRKMHRRISSPDLKIAAIALANNAILITWNEQDFRNIVGLKLEDWTRCAVVIAPAGIIKADPSQRNPTHGI